MQLTPRHPNHGCHVVKFEGNYNPHRAKSCILILGNHEDCTFNKSQRFSPVLSYSSLRILTSKTIEKICILQQGYCKNAFFGALLPEDEITIVRPPLGDPNSSPDKLWFLNKMLYGLRQSPQHWYNLITEILKDMGLTSSNRNPCLFYGIIDDGTPPTTPRHPINVGLYVDDFVFFLDSDAEEYRFKKLLNKKVATDFIGNVDFFLGSSFKWNWCPDVNISVHISQQSFAKNTTFCFSLKDCNRVPLMTPYRSG